jgi:hypothetical protein
MPDVFIHMEGGVLQNVTGLTEYYLIDRDALVEGNCPICHEAIEMKGGTHYTSEQTVVTTSIITVDGVPGEKQTSEKHYNNEWWDDAHKWCPRCEIDWDDPDLDYKKMEEVAKAKCFPSGNDDD